MAYPCPQWFANSTVVEGTGTIQPSTPAGILPDDLVLYFIQTSNQAPTNPPSGFTAVPNSPQGTGAAGAAGSTALYVFYRWGPGTIPATGDSGDHQFAFAQVWRHVNRADPFGPGQGSVKSSASTSTTIPGVTTDQDNCTILFIASNAIDTATDDQWTSITDGLLGSAIHLNQNTSLSNGGGILIWSAELATAGATGDVTATLAASSAETYLTLTLQPTTIQYVGGQTLGFVGTASDTTINFAFTGGLDTVPSAGDIVVVVYGTGSTADQDIGVTSPTDYTEVADLYDTDTYDVNLSVNYKIMGVTPDTSVTVSQTFSTAWAGAVAIHCWRHVDPTTPMDATPVTITGTGSAQVNPPAITPVTTGAVVLACGAGVSASLGTYTHASLGFWRTNKGTDSIDAGVGIGGHQWISGAFDPAAFGGELGTLTDSWAAVTMALRPIQISTTPADTSHGHSVDQVTVTAYATTTATDTSHGTSADQATASVSQSTIPDDATSSHTADQVTVIAHAVCVAGDASSGHSADQATTTAHVAATAADATHSHTTDQATATARAATTAADANHGTSADQASATAFAPVAANDATSATSSDQSSLSYHAVTTASDSTHGTSSDQATLDVTIGSAVDDASSSHTVDQVSATAHVAVTANDSAHATSADQSTVLAYAIVAAADTSHGISSDEATIESKIGTVPADATSSHTAEQVSVTAHALVAANDASHVTSADQSSVVAHTSTTASDSSHATSSDQASVVPRYATVANDASHGHNVDQATAVMLSATTVSDALHITLADVVILRVSIPPPASRRSLAIGYEDSSAPDAQGSYADSTQRETSANQSGRVSRADKRA